MCLYPSLANNKKYTITKKNGGQVPPLSDKRIAKVAIACGQCIECRKKRVRDWKVRLSEEIKDWENASFVTFTFDTPSLKKINRKLNKLGDVTEGYERDNAIAAYAMNHWRDLYRKKNKGVRYWFVTEISDKNSEHLHLHGLVNDTQEEIEKSWLYGKCQVGKKDMYGRVINYVNQKSVNYIVKYFMKNNVKHKTYIQKVFCSKGIGSNYIKKEIAKRNEYNITKKTTETYTMENGAEIAIPIYYRNKIYSEDEREELWIEKLNEKKRYVLGREIDISKSDENYYKSLRQAQRDNLRWGYNKKIDWEERKYMQERRILMQKERLKKDGIKWKKR